MTTMSIDEDTEKYPPNIQKLFGPKPPFLYIQPTDYPPEQRSTISVTPISSIKQQIANYLETAPSNPIPSTTTTTTTNLQAHREKKLRYQESYTRQLSQWNDSELFAKNEREFMKDPYRTVFISRLDYTLSELDISPTFSKYGMIESVRIIRDKSGKSRGYGFIVFERINDAKNCVAELCRTGVVLGNRTVLVDIERGRIIRNWKPRRLGGGEGGRGYMTNGRKSSVAATARRTHIANNPSYNTQGGSYSAFNRSVQPSQPAYQPPQQVTTTSVKDRYAKYTSTTTTAAPATAASSVTSYKSTSGDRSIQSIRHRE
ncbi:U1 small nuclear ribonucleoprotein 70 kDa [Spathaspora sp. JA1]|nr:U1 small nuclear ribonucleoprotein 70 kDa [Spathaspora sp. JA1]